MTPQRRCLVLGATGRIGDVLRMFWGEAGAIWHTRGAVAGQGPEWVRGDLLRDPEALIRASQGAEAVLCLSGVVNGKGDVALNVALGQAGVEIGAALGAPVLLASSAAVYGRAAEHAGGRLRGGLTLAADSGDGRAEAEVEARGADLGRAHGVPVTALRIGNLAGLDAILGAWRPGFQLDRFGDGRTPRRSYIGVETLAFVLARLCDQADDLPPVLNVAAPEVIEMGALLDAAGYAWSARPAPPDAIAEVALDVALLQGVCPLPDGAGRPDTLVAEWARLRARRKGDSA